ncbi:DUF2339 domain-containing protein [Pseudovibrio sp. Tun.PSC04-5.I4]|uniref:DUF2339 domain-containing protein n=1 Tax=Pseudovibrio sp. Tun.PSC04-5.I4 TaxID=1798213 RepID=UPI000B86F62E|nr:DUF2339 domain-containing protein [Pseudovibrio sp. Tun.PSC04-5.I4]
MRSLLVEISRKLNFLNDQVKELHKSIADLRTQAPNQTRQQPEEAVVENPPVSATTSGVAEQVEASKTARNAAALANTRAEIVQAVLSKRASEALEDEGVATESVAPSVADAKPQQSAPHYSANHRSQGDRAEAWMGKVFRAMLGNFKKNWVVWLGALSLGFGGIFFVQYGIENGVLSPTMRVSSSIGFGLLLICGAEFIRRKQGSQPVDPFGPLVAAASGGLASLFGATIGAYSLYGLIGPTTTFIGLAIVSWLAIGGGLLYGPVLATVGILGAYYSPLLVSSTEPSAMLYLYFAMVLATSFVVERLRKWIWLSALSVLSVFVWVFLLQSQMPELNLTPVMLAAILVLTFTIPAFGVPPKSSYSWWPLDTEFKNYRQTYPAILSYAVATLVVLFGLYFAHLNTELIKPMVLVFGCLLVGHVFFLSKAETLDLIAPALLFGFALTFSGLVGSPWGMGAGDMSYFLGTLTVVVAAVTGGSLLRGRGSVRSTYWHWAAVGLPGIGTLVYYVFVSLQAPDLYGKAGSFGYVVALGLATCVAVYFRRFYKKFEIGVEASSALAFLLFLPFAYLFLGEIALPIVLMMSAIAVLEISDIFALKHARKAFYVFLSAVIFFSTQRYVREHGEATYGDLALLFLPVLLLCAVGWWRGNKRDSSSEAVVFETTAWAALSLFGCALLNVFYRDQAYIPNYVTFGTYALIFAVQVSVQLKRMSISSSFVKLRSNLFLVYWGLALLSCVFIIVMNPLSGAYVFGYFPIDSLSIAYLYPALALLLATERFWTLDAKLQNVTRGISGLMLLLFVGLEIRAFWQGPVLTKPGVLLEELYSYTVAMLIFSVGLISFASIKQRKRVGQLGLAFICVTCLKVFFIDMSGLYGLARATSFIGLGLTLVGIAWANKRFLSFDSDDTPIEDQNLQPE